jgi:hypothetical protein
MKTHQITCGNKSEIIEYFDDLLKYTREHLKENNLLYSIDGIEKQIDDIINKQNGFGIIFCLTRDSRDGSVQDKVNLELREFYVHVK